MPRGSREICKFRLLASILRKHVCQLHNHRLRPGIQPKLEALRALYDGKKIIVGRDKLDVVKGVVQKVRIP
jgi:trehalose-6-phosphate synthase